MTGKYTWLHQASPYTNNTDRFVVVVGANPVSTQVDSTNVIIVQINGITIDAVIFRITTSGEAMLSMPRRMLVPPGGVVTIGGTNDMSLVVCQASTIEESLAMAVAML